MSGPMRRITPAEIVRPTERRLSSATLFKEGVAFAFGPPAIPGLGTGSGFTGDAAGPRRQYTPVPVRADGAAPSSRRAKQRPEIGSADHPVPSEVHRRSSLDIDDAKALKLGVTLSDINTSVGAFLGGAYVNDFNRFGRLYKVYVQAEPEYRDHPNVDGINMFYVRNSQGDSVPLSTLVDPPRALGRSGVHQPLQPVPRRQDDAVHRRRDTAPPRR